ncbi:hypothetical protein V3C40_25805 [Janthinobacterium sp. LS2A]|uniref:hypothetical protein n=1 Tax=Janthinobacterium sp. LS2A TaxID=3118590 RepID=UPI002F92C225
MSTVTAYHQLGRFVVLFQHLEESVNNLLELLADTDGEIVRILVNELEYSKRLKTLDALFARFIDLRKNTDPLAKTEFHKLVVELGKLGERRNELVHSKYNPWINFHGREGLLRTNSKLRGSSGEREIKEEELQPEAFDSDLLNLSATAQSLEAFRIKVIDWLCPDAT